MQPITNQAGDVIVRIFLHCPMKNKWLLGIAYLSAGVPEILAFEI